MFNHLHRSLDLIKTGYTTSTQFIFDGPEGIDNAGESLERFLIEYEVKTCLDLNQFKLFVCIASLLLKKMTITDASDRMFYESLCRSLLENNEYFEVLCMNANKTATEYMDYLSTISYGKNFVEVFNEIAIDNFIVTRNNQGSTCAIHTDLSFDEEFIDFLMHLFHLNNIEAIDLIMGWENVSLSPVRLLVQYANQYTTEYGDIPYIIVEEVGGIDSGYGQDFPAFMPILAITVISSPYSYWQLSEPGDLDIRNPQYVNEISYEVVQRNFNRTQRPFGNTMLEDPSSIEFLSEEDASDSEVTGDIDRVGLECYCFPLDLTEDFVSLVEAPVYFLQDLNNNF